jgi:oligopeptide/dipeptide ABC transporter ATP-binding protein
MTPALEVRGLVIEYRSRRGQVRALDGIDFAAAPGEAVGIVGESGSGKSTLGAAIGRLPVAGVHHVSGEVLIDGEKIFGLGEPALRTLRRSRLGFVFQDPIGTLDPTMKVGRQVAAVLEASADRRAVDGMLTDVGLDDVGRVAQSYPHELSGGMAQRVAICMAMARRPSIIVADEPTAALDASIKGQILDLLVSRCRDFDAVLILLSHDLHAVRTCTGRVLVMYGGRVVEAGETATVLDRPKHPYTAALLRSAVGREAPGGCVEPIAGAPAAFAKRQDCCAFAPRCTYVIEQCRSVRPEARHVAHRDVVCHRADEALDLARAP